MYPVPVGNFADHVAIWQRAVWKYQQGDLAECQRMLAALYEHIVDSQEAKSVYHLLPELTGFLDMVNELVAVEEPEDASTMAPVR